MMLGLKRGAKLQKLIELTGHKNAETFHETSLHSLIGNVFVYCKGK